MICNLTDLNAAIDWLERANIPAPTRWVGDPVLFRGWPLHPVRLHGTPTQAIHVYIPEKVSRVVSYYALTWSDDIDESRSLTVAPWVVDELKRKATVDFGT